MNKTSFQTLPKDLNTLILEFLPLTDYPTMQLVCRDFYLILTQNPSLWAKHLFSYFLDPREDNSGLFEDDLFNENPPTKAENIDFDCMANSRELVIKHFSWKAKCKAFFYRFLETTQTQELTKYIFRSFKCPNYPVPVLKKDMHFFPTNSIFQNFLTEVHFGLQNQSKFLDKRQSMFRTIIEGIKQAQAENLSIDTDKFLSLRWYMFDSINTIEDKAQKTEDNISELYKILYSMIETHCKMVFTCLKAIKTPKELLREYVRLWDSYVLTILELNRIFCSFSNFFNEIYNLNCQGFPNFPEFSLWRLMVKVWLSEVYSPILDPLQEAFRSTLMMARIHESPLDFFCNFGDSDKVNAQKYEIFSQVYQSQNCPESESKESHEERLRLLRETYQGMCDLSYDELTIFYWNCVPTNPETPKGVMDSVIMQDTLQLYECCKKFLFKNPVQIDSFLKGDIELAESLFCKELVWKTKQGQMSMIRDSLEDIFISTIENLNWDKESNEKIEGTTEGYVGYNVNLDGVVRLFRIQEAITKKIWSDKRYREMVCRLITSKCSQFNAFLRFLMDIKDELEDQYQEFQEVSKEMVERGFPLIDKKYESFFTLNQNPSCLYLHNESNGGNEDQNDYEQVTGVENLMV